MEYSTIAYVCAGVVLAIGLYNKYGGGPGRKPRAKYGVTYGNEPNDGTAIIRNFRVAKELTSGFEGSNSLYDTFCNSTQKYGKSNCLGTRPQLGIVTEETVVKGVKKTWQFYHLGPYNWETFEQVKKHVDNLGSGLVNLGLKSGDNLALYSETRAEWTIAAHACFTQNIVVLTVYANLGLEPMIHAFNEGEVTTILTNGALVQGLIAVLKKTPTLKRIIYTDEVPDSLKATFTNADVELIPYDNVEKLGKEKPVEPHPAKNPSDVAVIMYTSGTTGMPKGVMLTHQNALSTMGAAFTVLDIHHNDTHLSYLPLAHILAFVVDMAILSKGAAIGFGNARSLVTSAVRNCLGDLEELKPTLFVGVPSVHDKVKQGIQAKVAKFNPVVKWLFKQGYSARKAALTEGKDTPIWNRLIFNKFKSALGGRVRFIVSGGAPLSSQCCEFLGVCFGVPVVQGYGLTETCGGSSVLELDSLDLSAKTSGAPFPCCEFKLVDIPEMNYTHKDKPPTGEIWIRGTSVSIGYYKNEQKTMEEWTKDGWFKTGDIGLLHENGTFSIIDRKKNLVKPPHGEYIAPERLESIYKNSPFVDNIMVYASSKHNDLIALVVPNKKTLQDWANANGVHHEWEKLCDDPKAEKAVLESLSKVWKEANLRSMERLATVKLFHVEWTPENGWLTAALKLRRNEIHKLHAELIESIYEKLPSQ